VDGDGICTPHDHRELKPNPWQQDADSDGCGNACDPGFDQNGTVGAADLSNLAVNFGGVRGPCGTTSGITACPYGERTAARPWRPIFQSYFRRD
jgi:hypothetical protein